MSCNCSPNVKYYAAQRGESCCNRCVSAPPSPCCVSHTEIIKPGICFRPTCSVAAQYPEHFFLAFKNICDEEVPISLGNVFFYDQNAGFLNIHLFNGTSYEVSLVDPARAGAVIEEDACVIVAVIPDILAGSQKCLSGIFVAPANMGTATIVIKNGSAIAIGSVITFTWQGQVGSYTVTAFVSATGNQYAYTVTNNGAGHIPGTIINGGPDSGCDVPIEVMTEVDFCNLPESVIVDSLTGCLNGSPRAFVPVGDDYVPVGEGDQWGQTKITNKACCVILDGCLKFSGDACTEAADTIQLRDIGIECFTEAFDRAALAGTVLSGDVLGLGVLIESFDPVTRVIVVRPISGDFLPEDEAYIEYPEGTALCLGDCCDQCTNGPETSPVFVNGTAFATTFVVGPVELAYPGTGPVEYLVGYNTLGATAALLITDTYNDTLEPGIGKPSHSDPLVFRQKICNTHPNACTTDAQMEFNYEIYVTGLPASSLMVMHYELGHFVANSATGPDGVTPTPVDVVPSSAIAAGSIIGLSSALTKLYGTNIGFAGTAEPKGVPLEGGFFKDHAVTPHCACANAILWFYVCLNPQEVIAAGTITVTLAIRRYITKTLVNEMAAPENDYDLEGFRA